MQDNDGVTQTARRLRAKLVSVQLLIRRTYGANRFKDWSGWEERESARRDEARRRASGIGRGDGG